MALCRCLFLLKRSPARSFLIPTSNFCSFFLLISRSRLSFLKKKSRMMERITRLSNNSDDLRYSERGKCRLIDYRCDRQSVVGLESCDGLSGHRAKDAIDRSVIVTVALQLFLNIDNYLVRGQSIVAVDWAVVRI